MEKVQREVNDLRFSLLIHRPPQPGVDEEGHDAYFNESLRMASVLVAPNPEYSMKHLGLIFS